MPRKLTIDRAGARPLTLAFLLTAIAITAMASLTAVLMLSPALLLLALLLAGRAPGEEMILRLRSRRRPHPRELAVALPVRRYVVLFVRWSERMSASALAMRPPPARAVGIG